MDHKKTEADMLQWQQQMLEKHGWFIHGVIDATNTPNNTNYHTHGLRESFDHPDLQLCLPLRQGDAHTILHILVNAIKTGQRFLPEKEYSGVLANGYLLHFMPACESGRKVLRALIPDPSGGYTEVPYRKQLEQPSDGMPLLPLYYDISDITDTADVQIFLHGLIVGYKLNFHPNDRFENYIDTATGQPVLSPKDAAHLNRLMDHCFEVCGSGADIYGMALNIHRKQLKNAPPSHKGKRPGR